jgi:superfamily II DNA or RNA helicase
MISKHGFYMIYKKDLSPEQTKILLKDLTLIPIVKQFQKTYYKVKPEPMELYLESPKYFYIPRFYGLFKFGIPKENHIFEGTNINCEFHGSLYPDQKEPVDAVLNQLKDPYYSGGILSLPCGEGKTVSSIYIISQIKKKTIIIVHKEFLMNQWKEEIQTFLPDAKIGYIQGPLYQVKDKDIVIGMIQTMSKREYEYEELKDFGLSIYDECHHLGARLFSKVLQKIPSKCLLGLSAEPIRKDGMNLVFEYYLGKVIFQRERQKTDKVQVLNFMLHSENDKFQNIYDKSGNKLLYKMEENVVTFQERNNFIIYVLKNIFSLEFPHNESRQILVLSARNDGHLPILKEMIETMCPDLKLGFYVGRNNMNKKKHIEILENARNCQIILGTYDMAQEGLNIKTLNSIMLASPLVGLQNQIIHGEKKEFCNDIKQTVGRILREKHSTVPRLVIDLTDCFGNYLEWSKQRTKYYLKENYSIKKIHIDLDRFHLTENNFINLTQIHESDDCGYQQYEYENENEYENEYENENENENEYEYEMDEQEKSNQAESSKVEIEKKTNLKRKADIHSQKKTMTKEKFENENSPKKKTKCLFRI